MARLIRPMRQFSSQLHHRYCNRVVTPRPFFFPHYLSTVLILPSYSTASSAPRRSVNLRKSRPPPPEAIIPTVVVQEDSDGDEGYESDARKSRNQRKREARRAVRWGMELALFSNDQIKQILRAASLEEDVYDALMLAKRLGPDVREGKRRQFNYIGKLLREVEPDLMDTLINATKHGDHKRLQVLVSYAKNNIADVADENDYVETESEDEAECSEEYISVAARWFDGLISQNVEITNEVYSLQSVDFDRQELRKLIRKVHDAQEQLKAISEESEKTNLAVMASEKSLTSFLRSLAKQMQRGQNDWYF